jgi:Lrp/AsnC family transcriptional regulator
MSEKLDEYDTNILRHLQQDATISVEALAEAVNLSRNACWRRVKRLETEGVIARRVAIVDPSVVNLGLSVFVLVRTNQHDEAWLAKFDHAVRRFPEITGAHRMSGDLDYILRVRVSSVADYDAFYKRFIAVVPVSDISASFVMEDIKDTTALPL